MSFDRSEKYLFLAEQLGLVARAQLANLAHRVGDEQCIRSLRTRNGELAIVTVFCESQQASVDGTTDELQALVAARGAIAMLYRDASNSVEPIPIVTGSSNCPYRFWSPCSS